MERGAGGLQEGGNQRAQRILLGSEENRLTLSLPMSRTPEPNLGGVTLGGQKVEIQGEIVPHGNCEV